MRGLPILGDNTLREGLNKVASFTDKVRGLTVEPCYIMVKDGKVVAYGQQTHCWLWEDK